MEKTNEWIKHMSKVVNEGSQWNKWVKICNKWVKDMKQIMVVKRRGQNEHLKQGDEQKQIYILQQLNLTLIHKKYY